MMASIQTLTQVWAPNKGQINIIIKTLLSTFISFIKEKAKVLCVCEDCILSKGKKKKLTNKQKYKPLLENTLNAFSLPQLVVQARLSPQSQKATPQCHLYFYNHHNTRMALKTNGVLTPGHK